jgi:hypothetical protein
MPKQEILPPLRNLPAKTNEVPLQRVVLERVRPGGIIGSNLMRWDADRHAQTFAAVTSRTKAEAELFDAQKLLVEAYVRRQRAVAHLEELPEIIASERAKRRAERAEELRQAQHRHELGEVQRLTELAHAEAGLVDAQQALRAQREHGYVAFEIAWEKKNCEMLDIELSAAERRAILREHVAQRRASQERDVLFDPDVADDVVDDALYEKRAQLQAEGLDTSRIDALIERRKSSRAR